MSKNQHEPLLTENPKSLCYVSYSGHRYLE